MRGRKLMLCDKCEGTGFLNLDSIDSDRYGMDVPDMTDEMSILGWIKAHDDHGVSVCDCFWEE
jgi:hypothetical protein